MSNMNLSERLAAILKLHAVLVRLKEDWGQAKLTLESLHTERRDCRDWDRPFDERKFKKARHDNKRALDVLRPVMASFQHAVDEYNILLWEEQERINRAQHVLSEIRMSCVMDIDFPGVHEVYFPDLKAPLLLAS